MCTLWLPYNMYAMHVQYGKSAFHLHSYFLSSTVTAYSIKNVHNM